MTDQVDYQALAQKIEANVLSLADVRLEDNSASQLAKNLTSIEGLYTRLLLGTAVQPSSQYDWNIGFIVPHLNRELLFEVVKKHGDLLVGSEGLAWALGEIGTDDSRVVAFLYSVCERCVDYDAWWCAAEALEKIGECDAVDLKKKTLREREWSDLDHCLDNIALRPAVIGILRQAKFHNTKTKIIPRCIQELRSENPKAVQNAVWLIERLRVADDATLGSLNNLYQKAADDSRTLRPRIVEAYGQLAAPSTRELLEEALQREKYYRTRSYAAIGLGRIGSAKSLGVLERALLEEKDQRVIGHVSEAIYAIKTESLRQYNDIVRTSEWPETGMVSDASNDWYTNAEIYDEFAQAEDPQGIALQYACARIPDSARSFLDIATGTGRFALYLAKTFPEATSIKALDFNQEMHRYLKNKVGHQPQWARRVEPLHGDASDLPFKDEEFDCVVSSWGFPSKMWDRSVCLKQTQEVARVLKPGGLFITIGWDETFEDEMSELWYRFVPEPDFTRESIEDWRKRRRQRITSARNCNLSFVLQRLRVPLLFEDWRRAAITIGHLFGQTAGQWVGQQQRCEFSISMGVTVDTREQLFAAADQLKIAMNA